MTSDKSPAPAQPVKPPATAAETALPVTRVDERGRPRDIPSDSAFPNFGRFRQIRPIDGGGMGQVFEVFDPESNHALALKTWKNEDPRLRASLASEFRALARLHHPNLIRLYELSLDERGPFFTMELIQGRGLLEWVRPKAGAGPEGFHTERLRNALRQLSEGLNFLHEQGYLHRDIKPSNIMVTAEGVVKLLDFGVAVSLNTAGNYEPTVLGATAGTYKYMSPAQSAGETLTAADDWYSVGLVLFECLTGEFPFAATSPLALCEAKRLATVPPSPRAKLSDVPSDLDTLCQDLLSVDPDRRPMGNEVLSRLGVARAPVLATTRAPLRGRDRELAALRGNLEQAVSGQQSRLVLVHGRSGIGKSELIDRFLVEVAERGDVRVFRGRCYENVFAPYQAFEELLTDVCRHLRKLNDLERQVVLPSDVRALCEVFPIFANQVVSVTARGAGPQRDAQERRQHGFAALRDLLLRMGPASALDGPLPLLFIDDLQWGDLDSLALLSALLRDPVPCLIVGSFRSEDAQTSPFLSELENSLRTQQGLAKSTTEHIEVAPLTLDDAADLARELLTDDSGHPAELPSVIARQAHGNPLFVYELCRYASECGEARLSRELSLDALVQQRVASLPDNLRRLVELVAVAGRPVHARLLVRAARLDSYSPAWIQDLKDGHLLRSIGAVDSQRLDTYHDRVREAVLGALSQPDRQQLHRLWAAALSPEQQAAAPASSVATTLGAEPTDHLTDGGLADSSTFADVSADYEFVAQQLLGAGRHFDAANYFRLEADQAAAACAFERAAELYRLALAGFSAPGAREQLLRVKLADCLANIGHGKQAAEEYLTAAQDAPQDQQLDLRRRAALRYLTSGHVPEGLAVLRQVLDSAGMRLPRSRAARLASLLWWEFKLRARGLALAPQPAAGNTVTEVHRLEACWSAVAGLSLVDPMLAGSYVRRNLWLSLAAGDAARTVRALAAYSGHAAIAGPRDAPAVEKLVAAARQAASSIPGDYAPGAVALGAGIAAHLQGRWGDAIDHCDQAEALFRTSDNRDVAWELDTARTFAMWALMYHGDIVEMTRRQPSLLSQAVERNDRYARLNFGTTVMVHICLARDQVGAAREYLTADEALLAADGFYVQHHNAMLGRAFLELYDGQPLAAWRAVEHGWRRYSSLGLRRIQQIRIDFLQVFGRAAVAASHQPGSSPTLKRIAKTTATRLRREQTDWSLAMADIIDAGLLCICGRADQCTSYLASAITRFDRADMRLFAAATRWQLAHQSGQDHATLLSTATDAFHHCGITNPHCMAHALVPGFSETRSTSEEDALASSAIE